MAALGVCVPAALVFISCGRSQEPLQPSQTNKTAPPPDSKKTGTGSARGGGRQEESESRGNGKAPPTSGAKAKKATPKPSGKQSSMMSFFKKA